MMKKSESFPIPTLQFLLIVSLVMVIPDFVIAQRIDQPGFRPGREKVERLEEGKVERLEIQLPEGGRAFRDELKKIKVTLQQVEVEGVTIYPEDEISVFYKDLIGQEVTLADVYEIEEKITLKYREDGYVLSRALIPQQRITEGIVKIFVVEGFIDQVTIEGAESVEEKVLSYIKQIVGKKPIRIQDLERYLLFVNEMAGVTTQNIIRPSEDTAGASELVLVAERKLIDGFLSYDNYGSYFVGRERASIGLNINSILGWGEKFSFVGIVANPETELTYGQFDASLPIGNEGFTLNFTISDGPSEPDDALRDIETESETFITSVWGHYPFIRSRATNFSIDGGYSYLKYDVDVLGQKFTEDEIPKLFVRASYDHMDSFMGVTMVNLSIYQGVDWSGTEKGSLFASRFEADPEFTIFEGEIQRLQYLDNFVPGLSMLFIGSWQYSDEPLFASEEFPIGGRTVGRGFDEGELIGDKGVGFVAELQYITPTIKDFYAQVYGFYDYGKVWNVDDIDDNTVFEEQYLESVGLGFRLFWKESITLHAEIAKPITNTPQAENDKDPRYYLGFMYTF